MSQPFFSVSSTKEKTTKDDIVVEMKTNTKNEEAVLLKAVNGDKKGPDEQVTAAPGSMWWHCYTRQKEPGLWFCLSSWAVELKCRRCPEGRRGRESEGEQKRHRGCKSGNIESNMLLPVTSQKMFLYLDISGTWGGRGRGGRCNGTGSCIINFLLKMNRRQLLACRRPMLMTVRTSGCDTECFSVLPPVLVCSLLGSYMWHYMFSG